MIVFKIHQTKICFDFSFFAVLAVFFFYNSENGLFAFMCCIFHELGHLIAIKLCNVNANAMLFYGGGIRLSAEIDNHPFYIKILVLSAGCFFNFLLALIMFCSNLREVAAISLLTGMLNLLPLSYLDGAQLLRVIFDRIFPDVRLSMRVFRICQYMIIGVAAVCVSVSEVVPDITVLFFVAYCLFISRIARL